MLGKRKKGRDLFDVGYVFDLALDPRSFHAQLAKAAPRLFRDEDFQSLYHARTGRPSVPPSQLALLTLLQHHAQVSDAEAIERTRFDVRWAAVLGTPLGKALCAKSTLQLFRSQLIVHEAARQIFERSLELAKETGLLAGPLRVALDTKPIFGRGAVEDTFNLLATGIRQVCTAMAAATSVSRAAIWAESHDLGRYFGSSLKGSADLDWSDPAARHALLTEIVTDARRLLRGVEHQWPTLPPETQQRVRAAAQLLTELLLQDIEETAGPDGNPQAQIRRGTEKGRKPSATDPDQRHGHKSKSKLFTGHKASVAVDVESQLIVGTTVLAGDAPDATEVLAQVEAVEAATELPVGQTLGDCAYGSGELRAAFAAEGRELIAKVPQDSPNQGRFTKSQFVVRWGGTEAVGVTCPRGVTTTHCTRETGRGQVFHFRSHCDGCPLRAQCTGAHGRTVRVHPQEPLLQAARALQATAEGRHRLRQRVVAEHGLARLARYGIGQARYCGRRKTGFQLLMAAAVINFRRIWNWSLSFGPAASSRTGFRGRGMRWVARWNPRMHRPAWLPTAPRGTTTAALLMRNPPFRPDF